MQGDDRGGGDIRGDGRGDESGQAKRGGESPSVVVMFSGKRKSGKDHVSALLDKRLGQQSTVLRLSAPLKKQYATEHNLDYERLLDSSDYKEKYRQDMIRWGEARRDADPGFFCRLVTSSDLATSHHIWLISDARRPSDLEHFTATYGDRVITVRVAASQQVRKTRGWCFTAGVDDVASECALDHVNMDITINNDGDDDTLNVDLDKLVDRINAIMAK